MIEFRPLTYANVSTAFAFVRDCEDDDPCGQFGENFPARRPLAYGSGVHREPLVDDDGIYRDRVESFEDAVIAHLDGETPSLFDSLGDDVYPAEDAAPPSAADVAADVAAEPPASLPARSIPAPVTSLDRLPAFAGMHRAPGGARMTRRIVRHAA